MNKVKLFARGFIQGDQEYLSLIMPFHIIHKKSEILIYGKTEFGYQRDTIKSHWIKIKNYLIEDDKKILPTAVILGTDKNRINKSLKKLSTDQFELELDLESEEKIFRIVDGQHRLRGIEEATKTNPEFDSYLLNVIILLLDNNKRSTELNVFTNINSKARRIKVDLAELAKYNYQILENKIENLTRHISIKTAFKLKEEDSRSVWHKAIKFDIHSEVNLGIIGVTAFCESIEAIVARYLQDRNFNVSNHSKSDVILFTEEASKGISIFIDKAWQFVNQKWPNCFKEDYAIDNEGELVRTNFDNSYYIQRTLGSKTLNVILGEIVKTEGMNNRSLINFKNMIFESQLKSDDWKTGDLFAGLSSDSGFRKARRIVKNEESVF